MNNPLISIIVPIYNVQKYLSTCVGSILKQTYQNLEIILVDDGSPDDCGRICDEYGLQDKRVKVIHKTNGGLSDARNVAIDIMVGEYVTFIDSDDFVTPDYVETLYNLIEEYKCEISVSQFCAFKEDTVVDECVEQKQMVRCLSVEEALRTMLYQDKFDNSAWGKLYKSTLFQGGIRYPMGVNFEDLSTTYRLILIANKVGFISKKTYFYLLRKNSIEGEEFNVGKMQAIQNVDEMSIEISAVLPALVKATRSKSISVYFHTFLQMPNHHEQEFFLWSKIKKYRLSVLLDKNARRKARLAAAISFMGMSATRFFFRFVNSRQ